MSLAVCVFCSSSTVADTRHRTVASEVGTSLGRRGWSLVSGGGRRKTSAKRRMKLPSCSVRSITMPIACSKSWRLPGFSSPAYASDECRSEFEAATVLFTSWDMTRISFS